MWRAIRLVAALAALCMTIACSSIRSDDPPPPKLYLAYFEYHSTELRAETGEALVEAAASAKSGARIVIQVFSNDSTSNPLFYKSLQRQAGVVERELVALGISADNIATAGNSQRDQPPTPEPGSIVILAF